MAQLDHGSLSGLKPLMAPQDFEHFIKDWQQRAVRMMRAQERMANCVVNAARLEMRYGQELMASRMGLLNWSSTEPAHVSDQASHDFDSFMHVVHDVAEEFRNGLTEAAQILSDAAPEAAHVNGSAEPAKPAEPPIAAKAEKSTAKASGPPPQT